MARAHIRSLTATHVALELDHELRSHLRDRGGCTWRIDRDDISSVFVRMRQNLSGACPGECVLYGHAVP